MKEALAPLGMIPLAWNSSIKRRTSDFIVIQKSLINLKLRPSGPGLLSPLQSQTAFLTSSSLNLPTNSWLSWSPMVWKVVPFKTGLLLIVSWNLCWKKLRTSSFTLDGLSTQDPLILTPFRALDLRWELITRWKYRELQSPSLTISFSIC